jgi:hypothetical protein
MTQAARSFTEIGEDIEAAGNWLRASFERSDAMMRDALLAYAVMVNKMRGNTSQLAGALTALGNDSYLTGAVTDWADEASIVHDGTKRPYEERPHYAD